MSEGILQDFNNCWWLILIGLVASMFVSFLWIVLMRFIAGIMVWLSIIAVVAMQAFGKLHIHFLISCQFSWNDRGGGVGWGGEGGHTDTQTHRHTRTQARTHNPSQPEGQPTLLNLNMRILMNRNDVGLIGLGCWYCFDRYVLLENVDGASRSLTEIAFTTNVETYLALRKTWMVFLVTLAVLLGITLLMLIFLRNRIRFAIALIGQGSKSVNDLPLSLAQRNLYCNKLNIDVVWCCPKGCWTDIEHVAVPRHPVGAPSGRYRLLPGRGCLHGDGQRSCF